MKSKILLVMFTLFFLVACKSKESVSSLSEKQLAKQEESTIRFNEAIKAIRDSNFILEIDIITYRNLSGNTKNGFVASGRNFILNRGKDVSIQIEIKEDSWMEFSFFPIAAQVALAKYKLRECTMKEDKKGNIHCDFILGYIRGGGELKFYVNIEKGNNLCTGGIDVNGPRFSGIIRPAKESDIVPEKKY